MYFVTSMVRRVATRRHRVLSPTRHRFKQYVLPEHRRLLRNSSIAITAEQLQENIAELRAKEEAGILEVRTSDGRRVDLTTLEPAPATPPAPLPDRLPDSIARDAPSGIPLPQFAGGATPSDPAAVRAAETLAERHRESPQRDEASDIESSPQELTDPALERAQTERQGASNEAEGEAATGDDIHEASPLTAAPSTEEDGQRSPKKGRRK